MKTVLITGASSEIGRAIIDKYLENDYRVIGTYFSNKEALDEYKDKIDIQRLDLTSEESINDLVHYIKDKYNDIDTLINGSAVSIDSLFSDKNKKDFNNTLNVNLVGTFLLSKEIGNIMYDNKKGTIINISSTNGIDKYFPMSLDYDASKAALNSLTHNLAYQFAPYVRVNAVAPGAVATKKELDGVDNEFIKTEEEKVFVKRLGKPMEIANVIYFLSSDDASYINNEIIRVDGGTYSG